MALRVAEAIGGTLINLLVGAALFLPGVYGFVSELRSSNVCGEALHTAHISIFVGLMVAGALVVRPAFGSSITSIFVTIFPNGIPLVGGRRHSDPPEPPTEA